MEINLLHVQGKAPDRMHRPIRSDARRRPRSAPAGLPMGNEHDPQSCSASSSSSPQYPGIPPLRLNPPEFAFVSAASLDTGLFASFPAGDAFPYHRMQQLRTMALACAILVHVFSSSAPPAAALHA